MAAKKPPPKKYLSLDPNRQSTRTGQTSRAFSKLPDKAKADRTLRSDALANAQIEKAQRAQRAKKMANPPRKTRGAM